MSRKQETTFYTGVNVELHKLDPRVYFEKMYNPLRGGTPDMYYEDRRDLWVEYKYAALPVQDSTWVDVDLSSLQYEWLYRNYMNGHFPWVIIGTHAKLVPMGVILTTPQQWQTGMTCGSFRSKMLTRKGIAQAILDRVYVEANPKKH
jgi:hypothetical protein